MLFKLYKFINYTKNTEGKLERWVCLRKTACTLKPHTLLCCIKYFSHEYAYCVCVYMSVCACVYIVYLLWSMTCAEHAYRNQGIT